MGLNDSMTADDLMAGRMIVRVAVAVLRAAEFIDVTLVLNLGDEQAGHEEQELNA